MAGDPGVKLVEWIEQGAPAGVAKDFPELDWIFPQVQQGQAEDWNDDCLDTDYLAFENYTGVDEDEHVLMPVLVRIVARVVGEKKRRR